MHLANFLRFFDRSRAEGNAAVAAGRGAAAEPHADDDPMNQLRSIATPAKKETKKRQRTPYKSKRGKNCPRLLTMPAREPNTYPNDTATRDVLTLPQSTKRPVHP